VRRGPSRQRARLYRWLDEVSTIHVAHLQSCSATSITASAGPRLPGGVFFLRRRERPRRECARTVASPARPICPALFPARLSKCLRCRRRKVLRRCPCSVLERGTRPAPGRLESQWPNGPTDLRCCPSLSASTTASAALGVFGRRFHYKLQRKPQHPRRAIEVIDRERRLRGQQQA
jgi:hypothetical protein